MMTNNPIGKEQSLANENWKILEKLAKVSGIAEIAIRLIGQVAGPKQGNSLLKKACEDIQKILTQDDPAKADRPKLPEDDE